MKLFLSLLGLPVLFFSLAGCGYFNSVYRTFDVDDGSGAMVDIKQRAVIASRHEETESGITKKKTIVCAEPSPDALSAYAAQIAAEGSVPDNVKAAFSSAFQEGSAFVGLRTQSIQLLRDSLYRLCEGFMGGALDPLQYQTLFRRYQKSMVALLAIEQLTGTIRAPTVTSNTEGFAKIAQTLSVLRKELSKTDEHILSLKKANIGLNLKTSDQPKNDIAKEDTSNDLQIEKYQNYRDALSKAIESAQGLMARDVASAVASTGEIPPPMSDRAIQSVSDAVQEIVLTIVRADDRGQLCFAYLNEKSIKKDTSDTLLAHICNTSLLPPGATKESTAAAAKAAALESVAVTVMQQRLEAAAGKPETQGKMLCYIAAFLKGRPSVRLWPRDEIRLQNRLPAPDQETTWDLWWENVEQKSYGGLSSNASLSDVPCPF